MGDSMGDRSVTRDETTSTQLRRNGLPIVIAGKNQLGRLRRCVKRAFILSDGQPLTIGQILPRAYPRLRRYPRGHRWALVRALLRGAVVIGRTRFGRGRPNLWVPIGCQYHTSEKQRS
jgi:hypothetical protein